VIRSPSLMRALPGLTLVLVACAGCRPTFKADGTLVVNGATFRPVACQVLAPRATGVGLTDSKGNQLELMLPPMTLRAWEAISGAPSVALTLPGEASVNLGLCGTLTLKGEGYHGEGKRAASGTASLECSAGRSTVRGDLTFTGCF
jgi:hypothetical protein